MADLVRGPTKEDLAIRVEELEDAAPLPFVADTLVAAATGIGLGYADGSVGDGNGVAVKSAAAGVSFAAVAFTGGQGVVGRTARTVLNASTACLGNEVGKNAALVRKAELAKKQQEQRAKEEAAKAASGNGTATA